MNWRLIIYKFKLIKNIKYRVLDYNYLIKMNIIFYFLDSTQCIQLKNEY